MAVGAIAVLSILALGTTSAVLQEMRLARVLEDANTATAKALTAVDVARVLFAKGQGPGLAQIILYDLRDRDVPLGGLTLRISFVDEGRWIDLNNAAPDVLKRLPWFEEDDELLQEVSDGNFRAVEEARFLKHMTPEIYQAMKDRVTVWAPNGVNINTAAPEFLTALGMDDALVRTIVEYRSGEDGIEANEDDRQFARTDTILNQLEPLNPTAAQKTVVGDLIARRQLTTMSDFVTVKVRSDSRAAHRDFAITLDLATGRIVAWRET
jgi:hypothetical protein